MSGTTFEDGFDGCITRQFPQVARHLRDLCNEVAPLVTSVRAAPSDEGETFRPSRVSARAGDAPYRAAWSERGVAIEVDCIGLAIRIAPAEDVQTAYLGNVAVRGMFAGTVFSAAAGLTSEEDAASERAALVARLVAIFATGSCGDLEEELRLSQLISDQGWDELLRGVRDGSIS